MVTRELAEAMLPDVEVLIDRLMSAIFTDNPEWTDYDAVPREDLREGCRDYLTRVGSAARSGDSFGHAA